VKRMTRGCTVRIVESLNSVHIFLSKINEVKKCHLLTIVIPTLYSLYKIN